MGVFKRLTQIISTKANKALDNYEDSMAQFDMAIKKKQEKVEEAKRKSATFIGSVEDEEKKVEQLQKLADQYKQAAINCSKKGDKVGFEKWVTLQKETEQKIVEKKTTIETIKEQAKQVLNKIKDLEAEIEREVTGKENLAARLATAEATASVNELITGLDKEDLPSLESITKKVEEKENYARGLESFRDNTSKELKEALKDSNDTDLDAMMEQYKNM